MDLAALGLPMEQVRNVWLVAFFIYLACCLLVEVAYPTLIGASRAREVYASVMGSPVEDVKEAITELAQDGNPLTPEQEEAAIRRAEAQLESIKGSNILMDFGHILVYGWACVIVYSTFALYWDMAYDGILIPGLLLPFLMVYWAARWGRRGWRVARGFSPNERHLGMPAIYTRTLGRLSAPFRGTVAMPSSEPIQVDWKGQGIFLFVALPVGGFFLLCYLHSLANTELLEYVPTYIGKTSIAFLVVYALAIPYLWCTVRSYYQFTPTVVKRGRFFRSPKVYQYSDIERFKVYPWYTGDPEDIDPDEQMPSDWRLAVTFSNGSQQIFGFGDYRIDCLVAHIAFKLEQERWADMDSPADREKLPLYFVEGRAICLTLGYKPTNELTKKAARIASFRTVN